MAKDKKYIALFVRDVRWDSELFLPIATIAAKCILALTSVSDSHSETYSPITGQTKEEVEQELEKQKAEDNLFLPSLRKLPKNAEIIIVPKEGKVP